MEHPPKQGLKQAEIYRGEVDSNVLMEHPPKQGLKHWNFERHKPSFEGFNGTSTKTRIETDKPHHAQGGKSTVLMEHPPKQGLKLNAFLYPSRIASGFNGTSTKTRIETVA